MTEPRLCNDLKKRHPFESLEQLAYLNLMRSADQLQIQFTRLFRDHGLTAAQYNVLRILRGAGEPLPILEIGSRTVTVVPGITGVIDRLELAGLVVRDRSTEDRRVVLVSLTPSARELLEKLDEPVLEQHHALLGHLSSTELQTLSDLLEKARATKAPV